MTSYESALRLKFLANSASLLKSQSIATAAHLMSLHNHMLHEDSKQIKSRQHQAWCGACGAPRKTCDSKVIKIKQRTSKTRGKDKGKEKNRPVAIGAVVYKCRHCSRRTVQDRRPPHRAPPKESGISTVALSTPGEPMSLSSASISSATETPAKTTSDNASSKKRAKARKQGGLHALLASKRSQDSKSVDSSLDLFDFLQQ